MKKLLKNSVGKGRLGAKSAGFTLIELLVVIAIVAIISLVTISNYGGVQKGARLDYAVDSVISLIKEQQLLAKSGNRNEDGVLRCYAFKLVAWEENGDVKSEALMGSSDYVGLPTDENGENLVNPEASSVDICEKVAEADWQVREIFEVGTVLKSISDSSTGSEVSSVELYFKPPFGQVYRYNDVQRFEPLLSGNFRFVLGYDSGDDRERMVEFNLQNGQVRRVPLAELDNSGGLQLQANPNLQLQAVPQGNNGLQVQQNNQLQVNPQP
ncbi:MAG: pilus assembly FimT family protein [Candidatus Altimarinota bacterium]